MALACAAALLACGPGESPPSCVHVDGRGGAGADGSEARPLRTIADALAVAGEGGVICLSAGEHPSPGAITQSVTIRGAESTGTIPASALLPPTGGCAIASGLDATDLGGVEVVDASAALVTEGDADVTLERLAIGGCDFAIVARARTTTIAGALVTRARVGIAADRDASVVVTDSELALSMPLTSDGLTCGVCGGAGARLEVRGTDIDGGSHGWTIAGALGALVVEGSTLHDAFAGIAVGGPDTIAESVTIGEGTVVRELAGIRIGTELVSLNVISGARSVEVEGALFESTRPGALGLQISRVEAARIERTRLVGFDYASLALVGGAFVIGEGVELGATDEGVALIAGGLPGREPGPTSVRIEGALVSTGTASSSGTGGVRHVLVQGTGSLELLAPATLTGGAIGVQGIDTGTIAGTGTWTVRDVSGAAVSIAGSARATIASLDARVAAGARGADASADGSLAVMGGTIGGGLFGVHARERAALTLSGVRIDGGEEAGIVIEGAGGPAMLTGVEIVGAALGLAVRDGRSATARELVVQGSAGSGIEVVGASLDLEGGRLEDNRGAAIAFENGSGAVRAMIVRGTTSRSDARADEVRIVSTDGVEHVVEIAENMFSIGEGRTCSGGCSVVLASGMGAHGIVRPNCLTATPGVTDTNTLASQDGGTLEEPVPAAWADLLLGRSVGASWIAGAAIAIAPPGALASGNVPDVEIPPGL